MRNYEASYRKSFAQTGGEIVYVVPAWCIHQAYCNDVDCLEKAEFTDYDQMQQWIDEKNAELNPDYPNLTVQFIHVGRYK